DVEEIVMRLRTIPNTVRDRVWPTRFMLCGDSSETRRLMRQREENPEEGFRGVSILVTVTPKNVAIGMRTTDVQVVRELAEWLAARYRVEFMDESLHPLPPDMDRLFGPSW